VKAQKSLFLFPEQWKSVAFLGKKSPSKISFVQKMKQKNEASSLGISAV